MTIWEKNYYTYSRNKIKTVYTQQNNKKSPNKNKKENR